MIFLPGYMNASHMTGIQQGMTGNRRRLLPTDAGCSHALTISV